MKIFKDKRLIIKSVGWELVAFVFAVIFYWLWFGSFTGSLFAGVIFTVIKSIGLFFYLKAWKKTKWLK